MKEAAATMTGESETSEEDHKLFDETSTFFAADIANMLGIDLDENAKEDTAEKESAVIEVEIPEKMEEPASKETTPQVRRLAMPAYTREELIEKAKAAGEEPDIVEDETNGITFLDYSDIL